MDQYESMISDSSEGREEDIRFTEGFYLHTESGGVRRAAVRGRMILWFDAELEVFIGGESRSHAASRILLEELRLLPNYERV